jgi:HAD superfamily hydrolase (TIGR01509 family)
MQPTPPFDALIFDCDGTLVDSETPGLDVLHEEATRLGVALTRTEADTLFRGRRMAGCIDTIARRLPSLQGPGVTPADRQAFELQFTRHIRLTMAARFQRGLLPLPGAHALLHALQAQAVPFCVATNGPRDKAELTLGLTGLLPYLLGHGSDRLFSAYEVGSFKPDPGLFLHAAQALGVPAHRCAVVEDSLPGLQAGLAAGMTVFSLCEPASLPPEWAAQVHPLQTLSELPSYIWPPSLYR